MNHYLKLFWLFKVLALFAAGGLLFCLAMVSPWAVWALMATLLFRALDALGEEAFKEYKAWKALTAPFAAHGSRKGENNVG